MNRLWQRSLLAPVLAAALALGCVEPPAVAPDCSLEEHAEHPDCVGEEAGPLLTRVGPGVLRLNPGDVITLRALLSMADVGVLPGEEVNWELTGNVGELETLHTVTDENGLAQSRLSVHELGTLRVSATSPLSRPRASWTIEVEALQRYVHVVPAGDVIIETPTRGLLTTPINRAVPLRVRVTDSEGRPLPQEPVLFTLDGNAEAGIALHSTEVLSDGRGEASVLLETGHEPSSAEIQAAVEHAASAFFHVVVQRSVDGGSCTFSDQCAPGQICIGGRCTVSDGGTCDLSRDRPCPFGYRCTDRGTCEPAFGNPCGECPEGYVCNDNIGGCVPVDPECEDEFDCPDAFECREGICISDDDSFDITGRWFTRHHFGVRDALPGWMDTLATAFRGANQVLHGQLGGVPSWVNSILKSLVDAYIPPWVVTLVYLGDSMLTIFSDLRAEGEMMLTQTSPGLVRGEEYWVSFIFHFLPQCGSNVSGDLRNPPPCSRFDVYTSELEGTDAAVNVKPFWARVGGSTAIFDRREVDMAFQGLLKYALDQFALMMTGYPTFEEALPHMIDCQGLNSSIGGSFDITPICIIAVAAAGAMISDALRGAQTNQRDVLSFAGRATISNATGRRATYLGYPNNEERCGSGWCRSPADGNWDGRFRFVGSVDDVPGRWRAARTPIR